MVLSAIEINPAGIFLSLKKLYKFIAQAVVRVSALSWKGHGFDLRGVYLGCSLFPGPGWGPCRRQPIHMSLSPNPSSTLSKSVGIIISGED